MHATAGLCPACWCKLTFITPPLCDRSGIPFVYDPGDGIIMPFHDREPAYARSRAVLRFDEVGRRLVYALKYGDRHEGVAAFAIWMSLAGASLLADADIISPIPLSRRRHIQRRFNQAAILARAIARHNNIPLHYDLLMRRSSSVSQTRLSRFGRQRNARSNFVAAPSCRGHVDGKRILLIDDVITTGATIDACARRLRDNGAIAVDALALARVYEPIQAVTLQS